MASEAFSNAWEGLLEIVEPHLPEYLHWNEICVSKMILLSIFVLVSSGPKAYFITAIFQIYNPSLHAFETLDLCTNFELN